MGMSVRAEIVYGDYRDPDEYESPWPWQDPDNEFYDENGEFDQWLYRKAGLEEIDWDSYPVKPVRAGFGPDPEFREQVEIWKERVGYDEHVERKDAIAARCPFEVAYGGNISDGYAYEIVYLKGTMVAKAYWEPKRFQLRNFPEPIPGLLEAVAWAKENGLDWNPSWLLVPSYSH